MNNSGFKFVMMSIVAVTLAALGCAGQGGTLPAKAEKAPAPAPAASGLAWAEVLEQHPDPRVVTDPEFLKRITETGLPWRVKDKATGIEMLLVPPGVFVMGMSPGDEQAVKHEKQNAELAPERKYSERPAHAVTITQALYLGRTEVTQEQWVNILQANPSLFQPASRELLTRQYMAVGISKETATRQAELEAAGVTPQAMRPVESASWDDCQRFCSATGLRLPSEAEWEYACRAGVLEPRYGEPDQISWHRANSGYTTRPVAGKAPNALGFFDMLGNVDEWCQDWFEGDYYKFCEAGVVDPVGPAKGTDRVWRGGSFGSFTFGLRSSCRGFYQPGRANRHIGFRVARAP